MSTSGTIDSTVIATDVVLAHAFRRCGVAATGQTPENVEIAQECLFFLLLSLASRGLNLWCIDKRILDVVSGKLTYVLPPGTIDVLNVAFSTATYVTGTNSSTATAYQTLLSTAATVVRCGVTFSVLPTSSALLQYSDNGSTWVTAATIRVPELPAVNERGWYDMNLTGDHLYYRVYNSVGLTATEFLLASTINDLPIKQMNRDDYTSLPNKTAAGNPAVNYYFEKLVDPQITLWPVPNVSGNQFCVWRHRQIQDIGSLTEELELPNRWFEAIIWQLSARMIFELPDGAVKPERVQMVMGMTKEMLVEAEGDETDGAPIFYAPNIGVYTK